ncbi:MAG: phosphoenolpyruvate--protein phosphotransferase [Clostridia bacterium]|nr:phosphoenolpyruvate--protein phosphotransferase [Clostridia bacterium]
MLKFYGKGVYGAYAIGRASVFRRSTAMVYRTRITDTEAEIRRLELAKSRAIRELDAIYEKAKSEIGDANAQIFEIHKMMIEDDDYNESILNIIKTQSVNAEFAVASTGENFSRLFAAMDDSYMQARAADVKDISNRIVSCFVEGTVHNNTDDTQIILCADDLAPSETVSIDKSRVVAFVTEQGSQNSHTAILARNMNIPAVIGIGAGFLAQIKDGDLLTVDGYSGEIVVDPDDETLRAVQSRLLSDRHKKALLQKLKGKDNVTLDGTHVNVFANIGSVEHLGAALVSDAGGIGLFRSEFLYLEKSDFPTEDEQFYVYKKILESMGGKKVIIRTLDIGADKQVDYFHMEKEENPALGLRAVRIYLTRPDIFKTQMRALYRASVYGNLGIMFPMITGVRELESVLALCKEARNELKMSGISYSNQIELGIMIETPAAAIISDLLAPMVDFFSIGTNDLTQYTLACDRQNPRVDRFCDTHHDAILRLIEFTAQSAHRHGAWVGICGELASDVSLTKAFLKMGIDELSVSPSQVLKIRDVVRNIDLRE